MISFKSAARPAGPPRRTWIAPGIAGVAVLAVACTVAASSPPPAAASRTVPEYYIAGSGFISPPYTYLPQDLGIYQTASARLVARLKVPANHPDVVGVSVAASDRTFLYAVDGRSPGASLYLARLNPSTGKVSYQQVPAALPAHTQLQGVALSPDGKRVAFVAAVGIFSERYQLTVIDVGSGASRTWTASRHAGRSDTFANLNGYPLSVSWADDNVTVAFNWFALRPGRGFNVLVGSGLRLLDTAASSGGSLIRDSRVAVRYVLKEIKVKPRGRSYIPATAAGYLSGVALLEPGGRSVVAGIRPFPDGADGEFAAFSATSGHLTSITDRRPARTWDLPKATLQVLWTSSDGKTLIVLDPPGHPGKIAILRDGRLTVLPKPARAILPVAAW